MAQFDDMKALIAQLNQTTNDEAAALQSVSDRIDRLIAGIPTGGLTEAQTEELRGELTAISAAQTPIKDRLTALGQDPSNPIPTN